MSDEITTIGGGPPGPPPAHHPRCPCPDCEIERRAERLETAITIARAEWATDEESAA